MGYANRTATIIGGSHGGLLAGLLLRSIGWDVTILERTGEELADRGAGLATHAGLDAALRRIGLELESGYGVAVAKRVTLAADGSQVGELPLRQVFTSWSRIYHMLAGAFPASHYRFGMNLERVEQTDEGVVALFSNGERIRSDLLIGADGIRSTVRSQYFPDIRPVYTGYVAWRGLVDERDLSPAAHAALFEKFAFCLPPREQMLGYPVAGLLDSIEPGKRRYNFVWYRPADERQLADLLTDAAGHRWEGSIPPPRIRDPIIDDIRDTARRTLAPPFAEVVMATPRPFFQPINDVESRRIVAGRVALLGDAAFVARPHCGAGVTKAAGDAVALVDAILAQPDNLDAALAAYEHGRVRFGAAIVNHARHLGAYMQAQLRTDHERAMAEKYRTPESVMRETAVMPELPGVAMA